MISDRNACIILNMISGIGYARFAALVRRFGSPSAVLRASAGELAEVKGIGENLAAAVANWPQLVDPAAELELAHRSGVKIYTIEDGDYPEVLRQIVDPPLVLYVRGSMPDFSCNSVAIVGSRRLSAYGDRMAKRFAADAAMAGWKVVSGLAFGVDASAHKATLEANGITVGVLGGGLLRIHPQEHVPLAAEIVRRGGAIISEYPMNFPVSRQSFPRRNRIVSALTQATVVIEAGLDSGALITAKLALEQNRLVCALPGRVDEPQAAGCNMLIRDCGAKLVTNFQDVLSEFEFLPGMAPGGANSAAMVNTAAASAEPPKLFNAAEESVYRELELNGPGTLDDLSLRTKLPAGVLAGTLMALEIRDIAAKAANGVYALK
ncbi:MAG: DNA-protecting protein DprA [Lentisphaerae bacterium]|nr:DNA-protecting protein DprA [Lentisphaerota bacterium]